MAAVYAAPGPERKALMPLSGIDQLLWAAGLLGHAVLLGVLLGRRRAAQFPAFTALIAANVLRSVVLYAVRSRGTEQTYFATFLTGGIVDAVLQFTVLYEIASHVFRPLGHWALDARKSMRLLIGGSLILATGLTALAAPSRFRWDFNVLTKVGFFSSTLLAELFVGMLVLSVTVGLPWRTHVARIAHGLGAYSIVDIAIEVGHTLYGAPYRAQVDEALTSARMLVYLACLVYWIVTLWQEAPQPRELPAEMRAHLRAWQANLADNLYTLRSWKKP